MNESKRVIRYARTWTETVVYAAVLAGVVAILALVVGISTGGGAVRGKNLLFVSGWVLIAYSTAKLWPTSPDDVEDQTELHSGRSLPGDGSSTRFEEIVSAMPPIRWMQPPRPEARISVGGKIFLGGCFVLLLSFIMESQLGIV